MLGNSHFSDLLFRRQRKRLPHHDVDGTQVVTFRLADSIPASVIARWDRDLAKLPVALAQERRRWLADEYLDRGYGECLLARPEIAALVANAFEYFDGKRYRLHRYTVMPNHTHTVFTKMTHSLSQIVHSWKFYTARKANLLLGRRGSFWQDDYFDRFIRDDDHFERAIRYVDENPVQAGLVARAEDWRWCSAGRNGRHVEPGALEASERGDGDTVH